MIRIAVVEDDDKWIEILQNYIRLYMGKRGKEFNISVFHDGDEIVLDYQPIYDIIFLDIQMRHIDGMKTAQIIRGMDKDVILVFITNMSQYAIHGYSVDALAFLLKPVSYVSFCRELDRAIDHLDCGKEYLYFSLQDGMLRLDLKNILYIESEKHKLIIHSEDADYTQICTMKEMESKLAGKGFFRCNNCYLVNLSQVTAVHGNSVLLGHREILVSRPKKKAFLTALADYVGGMMK